MTEKPLDTPVDSSTSSMASRRAWIFTVFLGVCTAGVILWAIRFEHGSTGGQLSSTDTVETALPTGTLGGRSDDPESQSATKAHTGTDIPDVATTEDILGTWVLNDGIKRVIEIHKDGTASMDVTFDFLTAFRYGSTLHLEIKWTLEDNVFTHEITGGSPASGRKTLISDFGSKAYFKIMSIHNGEMRLVDFDDPPDKYLWKRIAAKPAEREEQVDQKQ